MNIKHYDDADGLHMVLMRLDEWDEHERLADDRIAALESQSNQWCEAYNRSQDDIIALRAELALANGELHRCRNILTACGISPHSTISGGIDELHDISQWQEQASLRADLAAARAALEAELKTLRDGYEMACLNVFAIQADLAAARAALEAVEWTGHYGWEYCVWCGGAKEVGHADDCARQVALGLAKKSEETK